jgi:thiol-disulfide isomerase/thioredoxin
LKPFPLLPFLAVPLLAAAAPARDAAILEAARAKGAAVAKARAAFLESGKPAGDFKADCSREIAATTARLAREKHPEARRALLVARLYYRRLAREIPSRAELAETRSEVPAIAPAWSLDKGLLPALEGWDAQAFHAYLAQARAGHPDGALRRSLLFGYFTDMIDIGTEAEWRPPYGMLLKDFPDSVETQKAKARLESEARTAVGAMAPDFDLPSLEDPAVRFTPGTFHGKYVLVDFWASWCPDCVREMPNLHGAWARFKDKGLDILSLSLDRKAEHVTRYRAQGAAPMPWKHAFLEAGWQSPESLAYGVKSIPKPVLVGPDGRIVANGGDLRGDNLMKTLGKFLEP